MHVDTKERGEKRLKIDEVSSHLSVSMALNSTSAEVAEQPRGSYESSQLELSGDWEPPDS